MKQKTPGVLLDIDNTLYEYEHTHQAALAGVMRRFLREIAVSETVFQEQYMHARTLVHERLQGTAASHNRLLYFQKLCSAVQLNPLQYAHSMYQVYWDTFLDAIQMYEGAHLFLDSIAGRPLCYVTDMTADIQYRKIEKLGLARYTRHMVMSEEVGHEKPHPAIFQAALDTLRLSAEEVVMIGDDFKRDVEGARALGIHTYWFNPAKKPMPLETDTHLMTEVHSFKELMTYVG